MLADISQLEYFALPDELPIFLTLDFKQSYPYPYPFGRFARFQGVACWPESEFSSDPSEFAVITRPHLPTIPTDTAYYSGSIEYPYTVWLEYGEI